MAQTQQAAQALEGTSVSIRELSVAFGAVKVLSGLNLDVQDGEFLVLLGASGCGKSTLLNCIAGLQEVTGGQIWIGGKNVTWSEPSDRGIAMVFQSYALYPQMTVAGNLSFGLRNARLPKAEIKARVDRAASLLHLEPLLARKPSALSGGQRQRVAIGRALVRDVDVFLFDEPLSNLDAKLRAELRVELKRLHNNLGNTMIYVTHDQIEAMTLANRIAIMKGGVIQQLAAPNDIYNRPANLYVAGFIGAPPMNFLSGQLEGTTFKGAVTLEMQGYDFATPPRDGAVVFGIRPEHLTIGDAAEAAPVKTEVEVEIVEPMGADTLLLARIGSDEMHIRIDGQTTIREGQRLIVGIDPARASLFDAQTELRL